MKNYFRHHAARLGGPKKGQRFMDSRKSCRHNGPTDCVLCLAQDTFWNGSTFANIERWTDVEVHGARFLCHEGHANARCQGLTLRPAAVALARVLPGNIRPGMRVLELGAGLGLPGRVAAFLGAAVTFSEIEPGAVERLRSETERDGLRCTIDTRLWEKIDGEFDAVIGSEILYDRELIRRGLGLTKKVWTGRGPVLFTDPGRRRVEIGRDFPNRGIPLAVQSLQTTMLDERPVVVDLWSAPGSLEGF